MEMVVINEVKKIDFESRAYTLNKKQRKAFQEKARTLEIGEAIVVTTTKVIDYVHVQNWARAMYGRKFSVRYMQPNERIYIYAIRVN